MSTRSRVLSLCFIGLGLLGAISSLTVGPGYRTWAPGEGWVNDPDWLARIVQASVALILFVPVGVLIHLIGKLPPHPPTAPGMPPYWSRYEKTGLLWLVGTVAAFFGAPLATGWTFDPSTPAGIQFIPTGDRSIGILLVLLSPMTFALYVYLTERDARRPAEPDPAQPPRTEG